MVASPPDYAERSQRILEAAGFEVVPLVRPIRGVWDLLGASPQGHHDRGGRRPDAFPPATRCLLHRWTANAPYPAVLSV